MTDIRPVQAAVRQAGKRKPAASSEETQVEFASLFGQKSVQRDSTEEPTISEKAGAEKTEAENQEGSEDRSLSFIPAEQEIWAVETASKNWMKETMNAAWTGMKTAGTETEEMTVSEKETIPEFGMGKDDLTAAVVKRAVETEAGESGSVKKSPANITAPDKLDLEEMPTEKEPLMIKTADKAGEAAVKATSQSPMAEHEEPEKRDGQEVGAEKLSFMDTKAALEHTSAERTAEAVRPISFAEHEEASGGVVHTTDTRLPQDLGKAIALRMPNQNEELTIELEPHSLGKIIVKVTYESERATVALIASNPKTMELLSRDAGSIAGIIQEKTGQETFVYTPQREEPPEHHSQRQQEQGGRGQEQRRDRRKEESESFLQQFRLGLV